MGGIILFLFLFGHHPPRRISDGFKVHKDIGIILGLQGIRASMNDTVGFVENHLTGLQGEIGGDTIVSNDLQGPMVIITLLCNMQNGGYH